MYLHDSVDGRRCVVIEVVILGEDDVHGEAAAGYVEDLRRATGRTAGCTAGYIAGLKKGLVMFACVSGAVSQ